MRCVLVSPAADFQEMIRAQCARIGVDYVCCSRGRQCMDYLAIGLGDFVIVNQQLDDMSGLSLCTKIRQMSQKRYLPILFITDSEDWEELQGLANLGVGEIFSQSDEHRIEHWIMQNTERQVALQANEGRILCVEQPDSGRPAVLAEMTHRLGLEALSCSSSHDALLTILSMEIDLVVLDYSFRDEQSSAELLKSIRQLKMPFGRIPVLVLFQEKDHSQRIELYRAGANDSLQVPIVLEEFAARVGVHLRNKQLLDQVEAQKKELERMVLTDRLTGLYNRHALNDLVPEFFKKALARRVPISLILLDLDHFKHINDTYGHPMGDLVLELCARVISDQQGAADLSIRFGGEEFMILLDSCSQSMAYQKAELLREKIEHEMPGNLLVTASIGVSTLMPDDPRGLENLLAAADVAVYDAKQQGRNRVIFREL